MERSRTKAVIGAGILTLAVDMIVGVPWFVSWPLAGAGLFLLTWGVMPARTSRAIAALPMGENINTKLDEFGEWLEGAAAKTVYDQEIASALQDAYECGAELYDARRRMDDRNWIPEMEKWVGETTELLSSTISDDAYLFKTNCAKPGSNLPTEFEAKVQLLRWIVAKYLSRKKGS